MNNLNYDTIYAGNVLDTVCGSQMYDWGMSLRAIQLN